MTTWTFEPGHTEVGFRARHMMVTWVRGLFKDVHGSMQFDWEACLETTFRGVIDARKVWTGEPDRDAHLRSADFFDVERHPTITFDGRFAVRTGADSFMAIANLTMRGVTQQVPLDITYLGQWDTPWWWDGQNLGTIRRVGWEARTRIDRRDFGISWNDDVPGGGVVVGNDIAVVLDVEAMRDDDLDRTGALDYYRQRAAVER